MSYTLTNNVPDDHPVFRRSEQRHLIRYIGLKLAVLGQPYPKRYSREFLSLTEELVGNLQEMKRHLPDFRCPVDDRIQNFLDRHLSDAAGVDDVPRLPSQTFELDRPGVAGELALPATGDRFQNEMIDTTRVLNGSLHNPRFDRRTTKGSFHVVEGGLPVPPDKRAVPKSVFARLLADAVNPPEHHCVLPFTANEEEKAHAITSILMRPLVVPEVPNHSPARTMEVRFFVPGSMVCNLEFVEKIFGNAGDPYLPENDAALDVDGWTGHTGCVILCPHVQRLTKRELGLPHISEATERQKRDRMCWEKEDELYNDGDAFKISCRTDEGVVVTLIADNYFGYCKKEVKTQISYAANLLGGAEEEHAGGAFAMPSYNLGEYFRLYSGVAGRDRKWKDVSTEYADLMEVHPEGYGIDLKYANVVYVPEDTELDLGTQMVSWENEHGEQSIRIRPDHNYVFPNGYRVRMEKHPEAPSWQLIGTAPEGVYCHKPCTVSGGGKSEISKDITDFFHYGSIFVSDFDADMKKVEEIITRDYTDRFKVPADYSKQPPRSVLSTRRTLGSLIKLLTPSAEYTDQYNKWLEGIPDYIKAIVFVIKRFYRPEWGEDWKSHFGTDMVNGAPGHELKIDGRRIVAKYLRIGFTQNHGWREFKLRQDFNAAAKIQREDDITASTVVPAEMLPTVADTWTNPSLKLAVNCEMRLFQRPDEAINPGADRQTERDMSQPGNLLVNFEPQQTSEARAIVDDVMTFGKYSPPMQEFLREAAAQDESAWFVCSSRPRIWEGKPSKNPRYLQTRPDLLNNLENHLAEVGVRFLRGVKKDTPVHYPVNAVLAGRRNNPPDKEAGIRPLAVYNPIHYQELPELFMDFISSLTGKSPSTTGAGTEGALTKGPFNMLNATADLNTALVSYILTGYPGFTTAAGYVGPNYRVDHDISLLVPEVWCRMNDEERDPEYLIRMGCLEQVKDFEHNGRQVPASRLGWRITRKFCGLFLGRVFDSPTAVFNEEMLRPETQDLDSYVDGIFNITEAQQRVAKGYLEDGSVEAACPPLRALLHIMAEGTWEGKTVHDPEVRQMFTLEYLLGSDWYAERLRNKQDRDISLRECQVKYLEDFLARKSHRHVATRLNVAERLAGVRAELTRVRTPEYLRSLRGTLGADPLFRG